MENFTFQALQAYNYWYSPSPTAVRTVGTLSCGHVGILGAPMCKSCADALISQSLVDEDQYGKLIDELVVAYVKEDREDSHLAGLSSLPVTGPLPAFAEAFLNHLSNTNHSSGTLAVYAGVLGLFFAYLSPDPTHYTLEELANTNHQRIEAFLIHCRKHRGNGPASLAHKQSAIKSLYRYLIREDMLIVDVTEKLDPINVQEKLLKALKPDEVARLAEELESDKRYKWTRERDRAIVFTFIGTGLRVSELCHLNLSDIDFERGLLRIVGKGGDEANAPFGEDVEQALHAYIDLERPRYESKQHSPALFLSIRGSRLSVDAVQILVVNALEAIGIHGFTTHKLRSTAGTMLLRETGDIALVQDFLRHKDSKTTRRYTTILQEELRRAANQIHIK